MIDLEKAKADALQRFERHEMIVKYDDGNGFRHLVFTVPGDNNDRFELVSFGNTLVYTGDIGSYVFERRDDMFSMFRNTENEFVIRPDYWSKKVVAYDRHDGLDEFDPQMFKEDIQSMAKEHIEDIEHINGKLSNEEKSSFFGEINSHFYEIENEEEAQNALDSLTRDFTAKLFKNFNLEDVYPYEYKTYTERFILCCCAIVWGVQMYDKSIENKIL